MTATAFANLIITLLLSSLLAFAYTYLLNRKKITNRKEFALIAITTASVSLLVHWFVVHYIYFTTTFSLLLFLTLPFLVCLIVSSRFMLGKK